QARFREYMRHVEGDPTVETLPGMVIHNVCPLLVEALARLVRDEKKPDVIARVLAAESLLQGIMGYHANPNLRPPLEDFTAARIDELKTRNPTADAMQVHMAASKAETDYRTKFQGARGWR